MALMDVTVLEQNIIEVIREAIAAPDRSSSRQGTIGGRAIKVHVYKLKNTSRKRWMMTLNIKSGTDL